MPVKDPEDIKRKTKKDKIRSRIQRNGTHTKKHIRLKYSTSNKSKKLNNNFVN